jgi:hypothetical protein
VQTKFTNALAQAYGLPPEITLAILEQDFTGEQRNAVMRMCCLIKYLTQHNLIDVKGTFAVIFGDDSPEKDALIAKLMELEKRHMQGFLAEAFMRLYCDQ